MSRPGRQTFPSENRLRKRQDYIQLQTRGFRLRTPHFFVYILANHLERTRLGITVSRRVGNAVVRNRVKRLLREHFRRSKMSLPPGQDISIIARPGAGSLDYSNVGAELRILYNR